MKSKKIPSHLLLFATIFLEFFQSSGLGPSVLLCFRRPVATCHFDNTMTKERTSSDQPSQSSEPSPLAISQLFQEVLEQEESKPDPPSTSHIYEKGHHLHRYLPAVPPSLTNFPAVTNPTSSNENQLDHLHSRHQRDQNSYTLITPVRDLSGPTISPVNPFFRGTSAASRRVGRSGHGVGFVQPASYLRPRDHLIPMAPIQPARAIDGDEQLGLVSDCLASFCHLRHVFGHRCLPPPTMPITFISLQGSKISCF
jgi:hypothetical protein